MNDPRVLKSDYMDFAKFSSVARYNLATSGVKDCALSDFHELSLNELALHGPNAGGYPPLKQKIADRFGIDAACVVMPGGGCSFANHLALAALVSPGDEVLIEDPTYELLISTLGYLQAEVRTVRRDPAVLWRFDPDAVAAAMTKRTRLVVLTNLHNPSGDFAQDEALWTIAQAADAVGARVLVDEVYRELMFNDLAAKTVFRPGGNIVVTSSLTKAYGLSGLRCGWILAPPPLAHAMSRLNDLYGVHPPHIAERLSVIAFDQLHHFRARANALIDANRAAYLDILGAHPKLDQAICAQGTTMFPRLLETDGDALFQRLTRDFQTSVVPGRFFGRPDHIRVGLAGDPEMTRTGLERLADALG